MKYIFSILFICSSYVSFGQMTVSELMRIYKMDLDQFETYTLNKGFEFNNLTNEENAYGHTYSKGLGKNSKYLKLYTRFYNYGVTVIYQTSNSNEYLNIKNQINALGFKLFSSDEFLDKDKNTVLSKSYRNSIWQINLLSGSGTGDYEISLSKL